MMNLLLNLGLTLVIVVGAVRVNAGTSTAGNIIAFLSYFTIILNAMMAVTRIFVMCSRGSASGSRIAQVLDTPADLPVRPAPRQDSPLPRGVRPRDLLLRQKGAQRGGHLLPPKARETLGIIGATGCGKSTLMALLMRLYDADGGSNPHRRPSHHLHPLPRAPHQVRGGVPERRDLRRHHLREHRLRPGPAPGGHREGRPLRPGLGVHLPPCPTAWSTASPARAPT